MPYAATAPRAAREDAASNPLSHTHAAAHAHNGDAPSRTRLCSQICSDAGTRFKEAAWNSCRNWYTISNAVYLGYAISLWVINYRLYPELLHLYEGMEAGLEAGSGSEMEGTGSSSSGSSSGSGGNPAAEQMQERINHVYLAGAVIHMINAWMYVWQWMLQGVRLRDIRLMFPEYLNIIGASLYLWSATLYPQVVELTSDVTMRVHRLEMAASSIEVIAAFGWMFTWWMTYPRGPGRGWTLDDPDVGASTLTVAGSFVYFVYYCQIMRDPLQYGGNMLYVTGDLVYGLGAVYYLLAAMRDDGWWWFMPGAGQLPYELDTKTPVEFEEREPTCCIWWPFSWPTRKRSQNATEASPLLLATPARV